LAYNCSLIYRFMHSQASKTGLSSANLAKF
jgi:hypothetical protein